MARGSFINVISSLAGAVEWLAIGHFRPRSASIRQGDILRVTTALYSPGIFPLGGVAAAERQRWSEVLDRKSVFDLLNKDVRPRLRLDKIT